MSEDLAAVLREHLVIESCHISGTHDPTHTTRYFCQSQKAAAFDRLLAVANLAIEDLPRAFGDYAEKGSEEIVRMKQSTKDDYTRLVAWVAGAPMALFTPGSDVPVKGDDQALLKVLTDEYQTWQAVMPQIETQEIWSVERYWAVVRLLKGKGLVEQRDIAIRLTQKNED